MPSIDVVVLASSGVIREDLTRVCQYLHTRGYSVACNGFQLNEKSLESAQFDNLMPVSGAIQWKEFVQVRVAAPGSQMKTHQLIPRIVSRSTKLFTSKQLRCDLMSPRELRQQAAACFDRCAIMQVSPDKSWLSPWCVGLA
jgi:hypothetical protein